MSLLAKLCQLHSYFTVATILALPMTSKAESNEPIVYSKISVQPELVKPGRQIEVFYENPSVSSKAVFVHLGFNGWNLRSAEPDAGSDIENGNTNYFIRRKMTFDSVSQRFSAIVVVPESARAMHFAFCWNTCSSGEWDNNGGKDYARPVVFPYLGPVLTWEHQKQSDTAITISFEHPLAGEAWIEYSAASAVRTKLVSAASGPMHRFQLQNLKPGTRYNYRVGVGSTYRSKMYSFKTLATPVHPVRLSFLVFGDAQDNGESGRFSATADAMASEQSDVDFVVSTGDMPWNDKPGDWWSFFDKGRNLFATKVVMPSLGNHDTPGVGSSPNHESFNYYFQHPGKKSAKSHYRYDVGPVAFFAMNSERTRELTSTGEQTMWLRGQLAERSRYRNNEVRDQWTFAYWHIAPFNAGSRHWRQQFDLRSPLTFFGTQVDWHFSGHEHLYQRMKPIGFSGRSFTLRPEYGTQPNQGVGYIVVPSGGAVPEANLVTVKDNRAIREAVAFPAIDPDQNSTQPFNGYTRVDINGSAISVKTFGMDRDGRSVAVDGIAYSK